MTADRSHSPDRFLAIGAGAHALAEGIPASAYPIENWAALREAASKCGNISLRGPNGVRVDREGVIASFDALAKKLGDAPFPILDADDLAHKSGMALAALVLSHHRMREAAEGSTPFSDERKQRLLQARPKERSNNA